MGVPLLALLALLAAVSLGAPPASAEEDATLEQLRALGYVDFAEETQPPERSGVVLRDPTRSQAGYNLYASRPLKRADLIDAEGNVVRTWQGSGEGHWSRVRLLPDGDLLVVGSDEERAKGARVQDGARFLERRSLDDHVRWRRALAVHHDVGVAPDGRLTALISEDRVIPELDREAEIRDEGIVFVSGDGVVGERRLFVEMLRARPERFPLQRVQRRALGDRHFVDLLHANAVAWMSRASLAELHPIYAPGNVVVTFRNQDAVAILDWKRGEVVWSWGPGEIRGPHDASVLANGNLLIFDNRLGQGWSRVVELDPLTRKVVWEYRAPKPEDFYTKSRGSAQRLANGNTLIAESDRGHAFEVTPEGEVVWDFWNPHRDVTGRTATIVRMTRIDAATVEALLAR